MTNYKVMRVGTRRGALARALATAIRGVLAVSSAGCSALLELDYAFEPAPECTDTVPAPSSSTEQTTCQLVARECEAGASRCARDSLGNPSNDVQTCSDEGVWTRSTAPCGDGFCSDGSCRDCRPGSARCGSAGLERCAIDGEWLPAGVCGAELPACLEGACVACEPGSRRCAGAAVETCAADGSGWIVSRECSGETPACLEATRECGRCREGDRQCAASALQVCDSESTWLEETPCSGDLPACDASTLTCICQEGATRCQGPAAESRCDGGAFVERPCAAGAACEVDRCRAQPWTIRFGSSGRDILRSIAIDAADNIVVTGSSAGLPDQPSSDYRSAFVRKYDAAGTERWTRQFSSSAPVDGHAVSVDRDNGVIVSGVFSTATQVDETTIITIDAFLRKLDAQGADVWTLPFGTLGDEGAAYVALDTGGNIYVGGDTLGQFDGQTAKGGADLYLQKYAADRTPLWPPRQIGSEGNDTAVEVAVDRNGNAVIVGFTEGALTPEANAGLSDAFVTKYDAEGRLRWTDQFGTLGEDAALGVAFDDSGNVIVVGYVNGALPGSDPHGDQDVFVRKYDSDGTELWTHQIGTPQYDDATVVRIDASASIFLGGRTVNTTDDLGDYDAYVSQLDANGAVLQRWLLPSPGDQSLNALALDSTGNIIAGGHTSVLLDGQIVPGDEDAWLVRVVR